MKLEQLYNKLYAIVAELSHKQNWNDEICLHMAI